MPVRLLTSDPRGELTLELLSAFSPTDDRERAHVLRMLQMLATTEAPFSRAQFEPGHFTASALVVSRTHGRVLLIAHPTLGEWLQPGGHLEPHDAHPRAGAQREVLEETGLAANMDEALFDVDVHEIPARGPAPAHLHFDLRFLGSVDGLPAPSGAEGVEALWLTRDEALTLTRDQSVRRMVGKALV